MGVTEILTAIFITLKVLGVVSWSWWLVLLPEIIAVIVYVSFIVFAFIGVKAEEKAFKKIHENDKKWR